MSAIAAFTTTYVTNLAQYLLAGASDTGRTELDAATKFADEYLNAVSKGTQIVINNALHSTMLLNPGPRHTAYKNAIYAAFMTAKADIAAGGAVANMALSTAFSVAAIAFWTGAMLEGMYKGMPPGHIMMTPCFSVTPGVMPPIIIPPGPGTPATLPMAVGTAYAAHLTTITFLVPAMVLPFPAPPYPLPLVGFF